MIPGRIDGATHNLGAPENWDPAVDGECECLPVRAERDGAACPRLSSAWYPTVDEIAAIVAGAPVHLTIVDVSHPPVQLGVGPVPGSAERG